MAPPIFTFFTVFLVSAYGHGVDSASAHIQCSSDHQCPDGSFCYEESQYCTRCAECIAYKRKPSWRSCPKTPSDCGACISEHEEEILHEGRTRDMCIPSTPSSLGHTIVSGSHSEKYLWVAAVTALLLPIVYYTFCRKGWRGDRGAIHHGISHEDPPPYRSIELTTLTSNNSEERLTEGDHVMHVTQQKDGLVQAVPFRQPDYVESELLVFDHSQEANSENIEPEDRIIVSTIPNLELHDDNTMPSDWTPAETANNSQLMNLTEPEISSDSEGSCEPASKRHKTNSAQQDEEACNTHLNINLFINNNVTIHKPS